MLFLSYRITWKFDSMLFLPFSPFFRSFFYSIIPLMSYLKLHELLSNLKQKFLFFLTQKSQSLILRSQNKRYRPIFFKKVSWEMLSFLFLFFFLSNWFVKHCMFFQEDLEKSLLRAARQQKQLNPTLKQGDIQVESVKPPNFIFFMRLRKRELLLFLLVLL